MVVLFCEMVPQLVVGNISFFIKEMNEPVMIIPA